ncbi:hypothetical protein Asppvi_000329 [Aspergillus pseudoviridinutans]|uniref:BZIP domain-containing protein n=1 Tax=Aspergillus pseudoviridinutans TaxID=1517512 RepID=A0A9P3B0X6_9EURO|nr:uncharacterized protein Asppvi_000329 [Aspergillus pseudoviridinutans]GIJ81826.1 hypothetical protein Asppvi_000329 [Aspergillus pseudoviridinutans]
MPPWGVFPRARRSNHSGTWSYDSHLLTASRSAIPTRSSSLNNILPFDVTSFTTDNHQQSWLPTPPPQQPTAQNLNSNSNNDSNSSPQEDFVLYPAPCPQPRVRDSRAPVLPSTAPRSVSYNPFLVRSQYQQPRRHSLSLYQQLQQQKLSGSPVQVPRVTRLHSQSTGYSLSSSLRSSPSSRTHFQRVHAASAPSNSPNPNRPPVPLFSAANGTQFTQKQLHQLQQFYHRRIMSTPNIAQDMPDFFGLPSNDFGDDFELSTEPTMLSPNQIPTGLMAVKDSLAGAPSGTISPKDLFMDASAPPSTSFTDLSTPSFESPGYFSQDTSPMFPTDLELGPGSEEWGPLFPAQDDFSTAFDSAALDVALALSQPEPKPAEVSVPPSPAVRNSASPAPSPAPSKSGVKHSTVAGVNARQRKPLPPIKVDSSDPVALKRARNTEAARKSRARKLERQDEMERRIRELEKSLEEAQQREQYWKALAQNRG